MDKANPIGPAETPALRETPAVSKGFFNKQRKNDTELNNKPPTGEKGFFQKLLQQKALVFMSIPFLIWLFVFKYMPLWGWTIAFQDFKPAKKIFDQQW
ncbi:sugar ABC transporter permease, partial [Clostridium perfringens]